MAENVFMNNLKSRGLVDDREIVFAADIVSSNGNSGRAWMILNGSKLHLYELRGLAEVGALIETIELKGASMPKSSGFVLNTHMTLVSCGTTYRIKGFAQGKRVIETIKGEL